MNRVKKGDMVEVISGFFLDANGQRIRFGKVRSVDPRAGTCIVEGVGLVYKHRKPTQKQQQGGRVRVERALPLSKVMPVDPASGRGSRVRCSPSGERVLVGRVLRDEKGKALRDENGKLKRAAATALTANVTP